MVSTSASRLSSSRRNCIVRSYDALGTLYGFKEPVAVQYLKVARSCGLRDDISSHAVNQAFKSAYKDTVAEYPNYGKEKLSDPQQWWKILIDRTFGQVVPENRIPDDLGAALYQHFSSGAAYELFTDARNMFQRMREDRAQPLVRAGHDEPIVNYPPIVGVVTNSDPRVTKVLHDLGLKVGAVEPQRVLDGKSPPGCSDDWNPSNDIDFVCASYEAGYEKPDRGIFDHARTLGDAVLQAQQAHRTKSLEAMRGPEGTTADESIKSVPRMPTVEWHHIGDDMSKDYQGAEGAGMKGFYLKRDEPLTTEELRVPESARLTSL
ncbi:uncharacterized protein HMPREF1541_00066 [Cyphellophora europaea CBS 101466]|uniref:Haloacid dehalogenase, type II n=1 Tax=Cyphellophora europaea (strain CBS 101466) TaxID=1220924 RepID=W2SBB1_CYPE1|nr:uncharacterized protein HMPREF1541_00066 [Cyphellophora europaea CBS 101466]ETN45885.1 hypothetical protein HMPREF1541_00066 [Cyphellophora europaea CBS 101466]